MGALFHSYLWNIWVLNSRSCSLAMFFHSVAFPGSQDHYCLESRPVPFWLLPENLWVPWPHRGPIYGLTVHSLRLCSLFDFCPSFICPLVISQQQNYIILCCCSSWFFLGEPLRIPSLTLLEEKDQLSASAFFLPVGCERAYKKPVLSDENWCVHLLGHLHKDKLLTLDFLPHTPGLPFHCLKSQ